MWATSVPFTNIGGPDDPFLGGSKSESDRTEPSSGLEERCNTKVSVLLRDLRFPRTEPELMTVMSDAVELIGSYSARSYNVYSESNLKPEPCRNPADGKFVLGAASFDI